MIHGEYHGTVVTIVNANDIICGRGGLALKHPGNSAYRKIVGLNKELYATCLKTEKLRISKSIVAAIREIKGRFLEREDGKTTSTFDETNEDGSPVTWKDIGDKRAVEKTSQALREGQPKLLKKLAQRQDNPSVLQVQAAAVNQLQMNGQAATVNQLQMNGQAAAGNQMNALYGNVEVAAPQSQVMHQYGQMQLLQQTIPNNFNQSQMPGGVPLMYAQVQQQPLDIQNDFVQSQQRPSFTAQAQHRPSFTTMTPLMEGHTPPIQSIQNTFVQAQQRQSFTAQQLASLIGVVENNSVDPSRGASYGSGRCGSRESWHDSWGSEDPTPLPGSAVDRRQSLGRNNSKNSQDSWGDAALMPLPYCETPSSHVTDAENDYIEKAFSAADHQEMMRVLGDDEGGGPRNARQSKRPSVQFNIPHTSRASMSANSATAMSLISHLSELSIFSDALSLDSAMEAQQRDAEFDMLGDLNGGDGGEISIGTFESGFFDTPAKQCPSRSILRKSNKWNHMHQTAAFPAAPLSTNVDPGMLFTSTLDSKPGGVNAGTDVSGLIGERRKSVVAFEVNCERRRSSRMSMCSALTDVSGKYRRDIGSILSIASADFRELMAEDMDDDEVDDDDDVDDISEKEDDSP